MCHVSSRRAVPSPPGSVISTDHKISLRESVAVWLNPGTPRESCEPSVCGSSRWGGVDHSLEVPPDLFSFFVFSQFPSISPHMSPYHPCPCALRSAPGTHAAFERSFLLRAFSFYLSIGPSTERQMSEVQGPDWQGSNSDTNLWMRRNHFFPPEWLLFRIGSQEATPQSES